MKKLIRIGARKSKLSIAQTKTIQKILEKNNPHYQFKIVPITNLNKKSNNLKDKFTKSLEIALIKKEIDLAVHSLKDLETRRKKKLKIIFISKREDPRDIFLSEKYKNLKSVPHGGKIATSSLRRKKQIEYHYPNLKVIAIHGNIDSRIQLLKKKECNFDALILSYAGIKRINYINITAFQDILNIKKFVPSPGQGILAVQCLKKISKQLKTLLTNFKLPNKNFSIYMERKILKLIDGSCNFPIGIYVKKTNLYYYQLYLDYYPLNQKGKRIFISKKGIIESKESANEFIMNIIQQWIYKKNLLN